MLASDKENFCPVVAEYNEEKPLKSFWSQSMSYLAIF